MDPNHAKNIPKINYRHYQYEDPEHCMSNSESLNHLRPANYGGHGYGQLYEHLFLQRLYEYMPNTYGYDARNSTPKNEPYHSNYIGGQRSSIENAVQDLNLQDSMCVDSSLLGQVSSRMGGGYVSPRSEMDSQDCSSMIDGISASNPTHLSNTFAEEICDEWKSSQQRQGGENKISTSASYYMTVSPSTCNDGQKESGQLDEARLNMPTESMKDPSVLIESSGNQKPSASKEPKPSTKSRNKSSSESQIKPLPADTEPIYHIRFDGFDEEEEIEPVGYNCTLCTTDLSRSIMDEDGYEYYEDDEYMLPTTNPADVAVLPCGHVFHDQCLQFLSPQDLSSEHQCCSEVLSSMM
ncbi:hypothetical protein LguiA_018816 [Lonicera macranthoides]